MFFIVIFFVEITQANLDNLVTIQVSVSGIMSILCIIWKILNSCWTYLDILEAIEIKESGGRARKLRGDIKGRADWVEKLWIQKIEKEENRINNTLLEAKKLGLLN